MPESTMSEYISFSEWLQTKHPDLYVKVWKAISNDGDTIQIIRDGLDEPAYTALMDAKLEFEQTQGS